MPGYTTLSVAQSLNPNRVSVTVDAPTVDTIVYGAIVTDLMALLYDPSDSESEYADELDLESNRQLSEDLEIEQPSRSVAERNFLALAIILVINPTAYLTIASVPVLLGYNSDIPLKSVLQVMAGVGMMLDALLLCMLLAQLSQGRNLMDGVRRALPGFVKALIFMLLLVVIVQGMVVRLSWGMGSGVAF